VKTERVLPSFDFESDRPCWMFDKVEWTLGGEGSDLPYRWSVNVAPCGLVGRRYPGCIVSRSCAPATVVLPSVAVKVDSPLGLEVVIPLEIPMILRPPLLDVQILKDRMATREGEWIGADKNSSRRTRPIP
jgi:hypothetical protein